MSRRCRAGSWIALPALLLAAGCADATYRTPLEQAAAESLTSHDAMMAFLGRLRAGTGAFAMDTIGTSGEGRSLVLLRFQPPPADPGSEAPAQDRLKVLIFAQQHGNEPSGKEASIALARDIATGAFTDFLGQVDLYLIPQLNPDGSEMRQRANAAGLDLNRDHLTLTTPEVAAVHAAFNRLMPHVVLDVHEYGIVSQVWEEAGLRKNFGQQIDALSNPNMSEALRAYGGETVIDRLREMLAPRAVSLHRYLVSDGPVERFRYSTTALNDGRNSTGIYNALSFLIEGRNGLTVEENIRERTRQQLETMKAFLTFFAEHAVEAREMVEGERARMIEAPPPEVALVMDYVKDPARPSVTVGVINLATGGEESLVIEEFHPLVETTLSVARPLGYAFPTSLSKVREVLERHGIAVSPLQEPLDATVETYTVRSLGQSWKEDKDFLEVEVSVARTAQTLPAGLAVVWCEGLQTNLIPVLLEPQSMWGLAALPEFSSLLGVGFPYPILRIVEVRD